MRRPADAYGAAANMAPIDPRENEAGLLTKSAGKLQRVKDGWPNARPELHDALDYNRKLWTVFAASAAETDHPLPLEIKQNIANLAVFVFKHSTALMSQPEPAKLDVLININRQIAAGLSEKPA